VVTAIQIPLYTEMILIITKINYTESTNGWALIEIWGDMLLRGYLGSIYDIGQGSNHYV